MNRVTVNFFLLLLISLGVIFCGHLFLLHLLDFSLFGNKIILAYLVNFSITFGSFVFLFNFRNKFAESLGYFFMAVSMLKFVVFFIFFHSDYHEDGKVDKLEFAAFFIPYVVSLFLETIVLIRLLNKGGSGGWK